jgi:hypothetical protein
VPVSSCLRGGTPPVSPGTGGTTVAPGLPQWLQWAHDDTAVSICSQGGSLSQSQCLQLLCSKKLAIAGLHRRRSCYMAPQRQPPPHCPRPLPWATARGVGTGRNGDGDDREKDGNGGGQITGRGMAEMTTTGTTTRRGMTVTTTMDDEAEDKDRTRTR